MEHKLVAIRNNNIVYMYNQGMPISDIADVAGTTVPYTLKILRNNGISVTGYKKKIDDDLLMKLHAEGATYAEMCKVFDCGYNSIYLHLAKLGLRSERSITREKIAKMLALRESGLTNLEIAERIGCHSNSVLRHIGRQPKEITDTSIQFGVEIRKLRRERKYTAKVAMIKKREEEARQEQLRIEAEKRERARIAKENEIRNMLSGFGISMDGFHIDSVEHGDSIINGLRKQLNIA